MDFWRILEQSTGMPLIPLFSLKTGPKRFTPLVLNARSYKDQPPAPRSFGC